VVQLHHAIETNRLGKINLATIRVRWCRHQDYFTDWHGTWKDAGGALANQAIHHIDLLRWLCGPVDTVFSYATTAMVKAEVEDTLVAVLRFASGALGTVEVTTATRPVDLEGSLSILGARGTVEIGGFAVNKMLHWSFEDKQPDDLEIGALCENPPNVYGFGHRAFYQDYIEHITAGKTPPITWEDGYKAVELIEAIYESVETGREIKVGDATPHVKMGK
jgi:predicted dehydrogenase